MAGYVYDFIFSAWVNFFSNFFYGFIQIVGRIYDQRQGPHTYHSLKMVAISDSVVPSYQLATL